MSLTSNIAVVILAVLSCGCIGPKPPTPVSKTPESANYSLSDAQDTRLRMLLRKYNVPSLGIGIIQDSKLVLTTYYGEQAPGIPLGRDSMFNTASVQKAVTTETIIRLAEKGVIDLDESLSEHYVHPDLLEDTRHHRLTPRIVLTHKTGFMNWPYEYEDGKLAFLHDPGQTYGYSGIGFMILAKAVESKLKKPWPNIVEEEIFRPLGMRNSSTIKAIWMNEKYVVPANEEGGFQNDYQLEIGDWNAADDLFVSVEDYAKFLIAVMNHVKSDSEFAKERIRVQTDLTNDRIWGCDDTVTPCPKPFGHGLGWFVFGYDGLVNIHHGGNDASEAAIGYIEPQTGRGAIVFVNSTQGIRVWPKVVEIIDEEQEFTKVYNHVIAKFLDAKKEE